MHIKSILAGAAMALVAGIGTATAADQFTTLAGIAAQPLTVDAVENSASNPFAALEGITAEAMTTRDLESVVGGKDAGTITFTTGCGGSGVCLPNTPTIDSRSCAGIFNTHGFGFTHGC